MLRSEYYLFGLFCAKDRFAEAQSPKLEAVAKERTATSLPVRTSAAVNNLIYMDEHLNKAGSRVAIRDRR